MRKYDIFISYSWKDKDEVNKIDKDFQAFGINSTKDERDLSYHGSIEEYMKSVRKADYVLMVISDTYLKSRNCMYEVMEFIKDEDYKDRILHIILDNCKDILTPPDEPNMWRSGRINIIRLKKQYPHLIR